MSRKFFVLVLLFILPLAMIACEEGEDSGSGGQSASNIDTSQFDTSGSITLEGLTVDFPSGAGWVAQAREDGIYLATNEESVGNETPPDNGAIVAITYQLDADLGDDAELDAVDQLDNYISNNDLSYSPAANTPLGQNPGAFASMDSAENDGFLIAVDFEGGTVFLELITNEGRQNEYTSQGMLMATNLSFDASAFE